MAKIPLNKKDFNNFIASDYEFFIARCNFSEDQMKIVNGFRKDWTEIKICEENNISSKSSYDNLVKQVKRKIIRVLEENAMPLRFWDGKS